MTETFNKNTVRVFKHNPLLTANTSFRGQSPMHVLGHYGKENAAAIFELFLECMPEYPLDKPDNEGNTGIGLHSHFFQSLWSCGNFFFFCWSYFIFIIAVLLLAYMKGNANLCRAIVRAGARLGVNNNQGINIFNYQVATKQLLFRLLGKWWRCSVNAACTIYCCATDTLIALMLTHFILLLLDMLSKEPPWCDGSNCYECAAKFGVTTRKHHW